MNGVDLNGASRELLPAVCSSCTWWQETPGAPGRPIRAEWEAEVDAEAGMFGRALLEGRAVLGWMQAAPAALVPRARRLPAGSPSTDAYLLTCAYFYDEQFLPGFQTLLQDLVAALKHRHAVALEAYGLRTPQPEERFMGYLREINLFNGHVLEGSGFSLVRTAGLVARYRLELAGENAALELELAEQRVDVCRMLPRAADNGDEIAVAAAVRAERKVHVQMPCAAHSALRFGRGTSSPPQFGQTLLIAAPHAGQNVHSYEQMTASPPGSRAAPQRSHASRISSAISSSPADRC